MVYGATPDKGLILVSCQGMSTYNVYRRSPPHEFVKHFTISTTKDGKIDRVTNIDGITAVGVTLGPNYSRESVVTHDDVNESPDGSSREAAAFKLVSLADVLDDDLLQEVDIARDHRTLYCVPHTIRCCTRSANRDISPTRTHKDSWSNIYTSN
jgi:3-phytase